MVAAGVAVVEAGLAGEGRVIGVVPSRADVVAGAGGLQKVGSRLPAPLGLEHEICELHHEEAAAGGGRDGAVGGVGQGPGQKILISDSESLQPEHGVVAPRYNGNIDPVHSTSVGCSKSANMGYSWHSIDLAKVKGHLGICK